VPDGYQGKRVVCARCRKPFWVAGTPAADGDDVIEAELADPDVITATLAEPATGRAARPGAERGPSRSRRRDRANRSAVPVVPLLLAGGAVIALVLLAGTVGLVAYLAAPQPWSGPSAAVRTPDPDLMAATTLPARVLQDVKDATVFVKVDAGDVAGSGSGFVIRVDGAEGYVVTNHHVIAPPQDDDPGGGFRRPPVPRRPRTPARPTITAVFRSGTPQERSAPASVLVDDAARDLAVLRVVGVPGLPPPIVLIRNPQLVETMPVFVFGFPFGDALGVGNANPAVTVGKGSVSSIRLGAGGEVARIQIDGDLNPGNSGGPVVDGQGRLVGVAVAKVRNTQIGLAIPPGELITLLEAAGRR
jgi:S1-C subfamily serine protease